MPKCLFVISYSLISFQKLLSSDFLIRSFIGLGVWTAGWILAAVFYNLYQKANTEIQHGSKYLKCMPLPSANRIMNAFFLVMLLY